MMAWHCMSNQCARSNYPLDTFRNDLQNTDVFCVNYESRAYMQSVSVDVEDSDFYTVMFARIHIFFKAQQKFWSKILHFLLHSIVRVWLGFFAS